MMKLSFRAPPQTRFEPVIDGKLFQTKRATTLPEICEISFLVAQAISQHTTGNKVSYAGLLLGNLHYYAYYFFHNAIFYSFLTIFCDVVIHSPKEKKSIVHLRLERPLD